MHPIRGLPDYIRKRVVAVSKRLGEISKVRSGRRKTFYTNIHRHDSRGKDLAHHR